MARAEGVAIVGMACRFPGAEDVSRYWQLVESGRHSFGPPPADRWSHEAFFSTTQRAFDRYYAPHGAFLKDIRSFAAMEFGVPPRRVEVMDPQQRLSIECAWYALQDAGYAAAIDNVPHARPIDRRRVGTYLGLSVIEFRTLLSSRVTAQLMAAGDLGTGAVTPEEAARFGAAVERVVPSRAFSAPGVLGNMSAAAVAQELDLGGPAYTMDAACASALLAVHDAVTHLESGTIDAALAGGVYLNITPENLIGFSRIGAISAKGVCRPFDADADGFVQGEGVGFVLLKRLGDAIRDNDRIYAVIRGSALNNDGRGDGPMSPRGDGQEEVIRAAWDRAGISGDDVGYIETHGTGTSVGDKTELGALRRVLGRRPNRIPLGSAKANIGHLMSAAGIAGLIKTALSIHHQVIPPLANWKVPHPDHDLDDGTFDVPTEARPWTGPQLATVSSFGFGGTNAHIVLAPAPTQKAGTRLFPAAAMPDPLPGVLVVLSADTGELLAQHLSDVADTLGLAGDLQAVAHTLNLGRRRRHVRAAFVAHSLVELRTRIQNAAQALHADPNFRGHLDRDSIVGAEAQPVPVAFLCPGQGMQRVGLLRGWMKIPVFADTMRKMEAAVADITPRPLLDYLYADGATEDALTDTAIAQPAMFAIGCAVAAVLHRYGIHPKVLLGHSLGEFTASALSGAVDPVQAIRFVAQRGRAMSDLPGEHGGMAAVMAAAAEFEALLPAGVVVANRNHPHQNVIAGPVAAVDAAVTTLTEAGHKARRIPVSHAFHSPLLAAVQKDVDEGLANVKFHAPTTTMASCIAETAPETAEDVRAIYARHAVSPVEYVRGLQQAWAAGARLFVQLAPGATLCAFARGVVPDATAIVSIGADDDDGTGLLRLLSQFAAHGHRVELSGFGHGLATLPPTPLQTQVYWPILKEGRSRAEMSTAKAKVDTEEVRAAAPTAEPAADTLANTVLQLVAKVSAFPLDALKPEQKLLDDLGFDSLMANELGTKLSEAVPGFGGIPRSLFASSPTLADLIRLVEGGGAAEIALTDPSRPLVGYRPVLVPAPLSGFARAPGKVVEHATLAELRKLPKGDYVVLSSVLGDDPDAGGVTGFVKALAREWADQKVCVVDGTPADAAREAAAAERDVEVVYRGGERSVTGLEPVAMAPRDVRGKRILVTGGTGWLGALIGKALVDAGAEVVLAGTRKDPGEALAALGAAGRYVRCDVTGDLSDVPPVDGIIHAAGVLADGKVGTADGTRAWAIKVDGLKNLRARYPDAWIVSIGSLAGRAGNAFQTEYAAANEAMAFAGRKLGTATQVWGPWAGSEMVATIPDAMKRAMREDGVWFVDTDRGREALLAALGVDGETVLGLDLPRVSRSIEVAETLRPDQTWLKDHALFGRPTVPMAMVMEWAAQLGGGHVQDLTLFDGVVVEKDVKVRRRLDGERFTVWAGDRVAWRGRVAPMAETLAAPWPTGGGAPTMPLAIFYREHTFHGPALQGIVKVETVGEKHITGVIRLGHAADWGEDAWTLSPLGIDSAFQLAGYWAQSKLGRAGFPVRVESWKQRPTTTTELRAALTFETSEGDRFRGTVVLTELDGTVVAVGEGVEAELRAAPDELHIAEEFTSFAKFPAYVDLKQRLDAALMLGITNPYFKTLEGTARDTISIAGRELLHFSGYNYLGFSGHPYVEKRVAEAVHRYGTSVSASRVASGERPIHQELESHISRTLGVEDAVVFTAGHATNVTVVGHLFGAKDLILHDELIHDSIFQGMKLSGATRRPFPHGDSAALAKLLEQTRSRYEKCIIIVEGVYSMDGDICDLPAYVRLKKQYKTFLMVDEAHSFGVVGKRGYGVAEHFGVPGTDIDIWMGTLSKSLSSCGGYIAGLKVLVDLIKYTAPGFVYSAGLTPANTAAAIASFELMEREPEHVEKLQHNARFFYARCKDNGLDTGPAAGESAVVPVVVGNSFHCLLLSDALFQRGINVQPILYPAVADNASRLRFFISALHSEEQLDFTARTVREELEKIRAQGAA